MLPENTSDGAQIKTAAGDVLALFEGSPVAMHAYAAWKDDARRRGVHEVVLKHVVRYAYALNCDEIENFNRRIAEDSAMRRATRASWTAYEEEALHPLGRINADEVYKENNHATRQVADWTPPLAFNCAFHYLLELKGRLFTFPELLIALEGDDKLKQLVHDDGERLRAELLGARVWHPLLVQKAIRWRIGCAYYSFLRELWVFSLLRRVRPYLRIHPLADTLFRTDFWGGGESWELLIKNDSYKSGADGRKPPMERFTREILNFGWRIELDPPKVWGEAYLPPVEVLRQHTKQLF